MSDETRVRSTDEYEDRRVSRRRMLRTTVAGATVIGAAGAATATSTAQADPGGPVLIDLTNTGAGNTALTGSRLSVTANGQAPAISAVNTTGPQLLLNVNQAPEFPPTTGQYQIGAIVNWQGQLFQCVDSDGAAPDSTTLWARLTNTGPVLNLLPRPIRVYASTNDPAFSNAKIRAGQVRKIDTTRTPAGAVSGVPPWADAVLGTVQLYATETNTGYLALGSGDIRPSGYSTAVWSAAGFSGVTSFTSKLGDPAGANFGLLSVACYSAATAARTHFFVDIVGYYDFDYFVGGPTAAASADATSLRRVGGRTVKQARTPRTR
jgi:hypothetical protein